METIVYYNLTQVQGDRVCYFRSTDIEQKNWRRLIWSVPDEMLYFLSLEKRICIIDKSTKEKGKIERVFVPVLTDLLNQFYFKKEPEYKYLKDHYKIAQASLRADPSLMTKFRFWKKYVRSIDIQSKTINVSEEKPAKRQKREKSVL